jgi:hypothetical protein
MYFFVLDCCRYRACDCKAVRTQENPTSNIYGAASVKSAMSDSGSAQPYLSANIMIQTPADRKAEDTDEEEQPVESKAASLTMETSQVTVTVSHDTPKVHNSMDDLPMENCNEKANKPERPTSCLAHIFYTTKEDKTETRPVGTAGKLNPADPNTARRVMWCIPEIFFIALTLVFNLGYRLYFIVTQFLQQNWGNPVLFLIDFIIMFIMYKRKQYLPGCLYNEVHALINRRAFYQVGTDITKLHAHQYLDEACSEHLIQYLATCIYHWSFVMTQCLSYHPLDAISISIRDY